MDRVQECFPTALELVGIVHGDGGPDEVASILATADLPALLIALAALVPDDRSMSSLLAWTAPNHRPECAGPAGICPPDSVVVRLLEAAARLHGLTVDELRAPTRSRVVQAARMDAAWLLRHANLSLPAIGGHLDRDHTTVMQMLRVFERKGRNPAPLIALYEKTWEAAA